VSDERTPVPPAVAERVIPPDMMPGRNGGLLKTGNTKNVGRTPSALRKRMRGSLAKRLHVANEIIDDPKASSNDRLRALDFLAKYGIGTTITETNTEGRDVIRVIREPRSITRSSDN
jgi:hypothetical protein